MVSRSLGSTARTSDTTSTGVREQYQDGADGIVSARSFTCLSHGRDEVQGPEEAEQQEPSPVLNLLVEVIHLTDG